MMNDRNDMAFGDRFQYNMAKAYQEVFKKIYKECSDGFINILDVYIKYWSDPHVQEFYYDEPPVDILKQIRNTVLTGDFDERILIWCEKNSINE